MAGVGDYINYANFCALNPASEGWYGYRSLGGKGTTRTFYIAATAFRVWTSIQGSWVWGYQEGSLNVYAYDKNTGRFKSSPQLSWFDSVQGTSNHAGCGFYHNFEGGSSGDIHDCHLWKVVVYYGDNDGDSTDGFIQTGGLSLVPESIYNSYFKGRKIYCAKGDWWEQGGTYRTDEEFLSAQGYSCMRGTQISIATGTYKYICAQSE